MANRSVEPEQAMAALFEGLTRLQRIALLGRLETAGAQLYRALATDEKNAKARDKLLEAAGNEEMNGGLMKLMSTPKDACEKCGKSLSRSADGVACSFQCTFCSDCGCALQHVCPNCGGALESRQTLEVRS
jgi:uncharacterized protein DUF1272